MAKGKKTRIQGYDRNRKLYQAIIEGDLEAAHQEIIMEEDSFIFELPVNSSDDTLLHVAISQEEWKIAEMILSMMDPEQLDKQNLKGDTPLHEVASKGESTTSKEESTKVAKVIVSRNMGLLHVRNSRQEIPLHKAALYGHTEMFDYLCSQGSDVFARREGGANVLHCAVMGIHLELAEKIVTIWPSLRLFRDQHGMTPLHLLVTNPMTFKSGSKLGTIDSFIYKRILPEEDISHYRGDEDDRQPDQTGGDEDGKKPMEGGVSLVDADEDGKPPRDDVSLAIDDEDNLLTPTQTVIPHPSKKMLHEKFPPNYVTCFNIVVLLSGARYVGRWMLSRCSVIARWRDSPLFLIVNKTYARFNKIVELKRTHVQALRLIGSLCGKGGEYWTQLNKGRYPAESTSGTNEIVILDIKHDRKIGETAILDIKLDGKGIADRDGGLNLNGADRGKELPHILAAKMGATSFVDRILTAYRKSANLTGDDGKNILQVAVEHRQEKIVRLIESTEDWLRNTVSGMDKKFDTILHSAARIGENLVPGSALQMQRELQWFERVEKLIPRELVYHRNLEGETAQEIFTNCHADMVRSSKEQLITTAQACSALVAAVVFATSFSIPGGTDNESGLSLFLNKPAFKVFTNAYVVGLSSAATTLLMFVSLIISPYTEQEFRRSLPTKFMLAFASLFVALACMVVAFSSNTYLTINGERNAKDIVPLVCELTIFPALAFAVLLYRRASFGFLSTVRDVLG